MIRLLHTADIHLGRQFPSLHHKAGDYRNQLVRTFEKIIDLAADDKASLLLIAGDLFDSNRVFGVVIGRVIAALKKLETSGTRVCILPGTHDAFTEDSIYRSLRLPPNVTVFTPEHSHQTYEDLDVTVYGRLADSKLLGISPLQGLSLTDRSKFHVGMAHCSMRRPDIAPNEPMLLGQDEIGTSGLDYLALGHWHSFQDLSQGNTKACYSGSPEPIDMDQRSAGHIVRVFLHEKNQVEMQPIRIGSKRAETLTIDVSPCESPDSIVKLIQDRADPNLILEVTLSGLRCMQYDLDAVEMEKELRGQFFNLRMFDRSLPKLDEVQSQNYPDKTVTGRFLRMMEEKIASARTEEDRALYAESLKLGFALLQGRWQVIE